MKFINLTYIFGFIWLTSCNDHATKLQGKSETIEIFYINWACDCAEFIKTIFYADNSEYEVKEEDCIYIEPRKSNHKYS